MKKFKIIKSRENLLDDLQPKIGGFKLQVVLERELHHLLLIEVDPIKMVAMQVYQAHVELALVKSKHIYSTYQSFQKPMIKPKLYKTYSKKTKH